MRPPEEEEEEEQEEQEEEDMVITEVPLHLAFSVKPIIVVYFCRYQVALQVLS